MVWLVETWYWLEAFRIHEILSRENYQFDHTTIVFSEDDSLILEIVNGVSYEVINVIFRHPKEEKLSV